MPRRFHASLFHAQAARATTVVADGNGGCTACQRGWIEHSCRKMARDAAGARIDLNTVTTTVVRISSSLTRFTPDLTGPACWHVGRLWTACGAAIERVQPARSHLDHPVRDRVEPFRDLPCARGVAPGRRGVTAVRFDPRRSRDPRTRTVVVWPWSILVCFGDPALAVTNRTDAGGVQH